MHGACRRGELVNLNTTDMEYFEDSIKINFVNTRTRLVREFVIDKGTDSDVNLVHLVKKYALLRPPGLPFDRFFISYREGRCTRQPIGVKMMASFPQKIAHFLKLPYEKEYTGQCFSRSGISFVNIHGDRHLDSTMEG